MPAKKKPKLSHDAAAIKDRIDQTKTLAPGLRRSRSTMPDYSKMTKDQLMKEAVKNFRRAARRVKT